MLALCVSLVALAVSGVAIYTYSQVTALWSAHEKHEHELRVLAARIDSAPKPRGSLRTNDGR